MSKFHLPPSSWLWILLLCFITIILLASCGPSTTGDITSKPKLIQEADSLSIQRFVKGTNGILADDFITADTKYTLVDEDWFKANVMDGFNDFLVKNGVGSASWKKNDCDDFARAFSFFSRVKSMQASFMNSDLAVADLYYRTFNFGHAINVAVVLDNKTQQWKLLVVEPQGPKLVVMDDEYKRNYVIFVGM